jgi:predicted DNA-binding transcriptional regulator AlpA
MQTVESQAAPCLLRVNQVAQMLGVSVSKLWKMAAAKQVPQPVKLAGRMTRWRESDVAKFIQEL